MTDGRSPGELTYEEAMAELDAVLLELDRGQMGVDGLTARLAQGGELIEELDARIRRARDDLDRLAPRLEALDAPTIVEPGSRTDSLNDTAASPREAGSDEAPSPLGC